jgi:ketosteroid isomerase-like protein
VHPPWAMAWTFDRNGKVVTYRAYEDTALVASAMS